MEKYKFITLRDNPELIDIAANWFSDKWNVPKTEYLNCMESYINHQTEYGWYLCIYKNEIVGGLGVIENDFHNRSDLTPNICAVYTKENHRNNGIAGKLLNIAVEDLRNKNISPVYLLTDHIGFYEKYGWQFLCMVQTDNLELSRMYIHK